MTVVTDTALPGAHRAGTGAIVAAALVGVFVVGVTVAVQVVGWGVDQLLLLFGFEVSWALGPGTAVLNGALVVGPALLLAYVPRSPTVRAVGRAWVAGAVALAALGLVRLVPASPPELLLALLALVAAGLAGWFGRRSRASRRSSRRAGGAPTGAYALATLTGVAVLLPWLWVGALGGVLETLLAVAAAMAVGRLAASILDRRFWHYFAAGRSRLVVGGLVAGVTLVSIGAGTGATGGHLAAMFGFPALAFAAAALSPVAWSPPPGQAPAVWGPLWVLFTFAAVGPLAFVDPQEVTLLLSGRDVPFWAAVATGSGLLVALALGFGWLLLRPDRWRWRRWPAGLTAAAVLAAAAAVHVGVGAPGFHGDRLFVIMAEQADLSDLPPITGQTGRDERAQQVYARLVAHAETTQADLRAALTRLRLSFQPYYLVNAVEVSGGPAVRVWLSRRADVDRVLDSPRLRPLPAAPVATSATPGLTPDDPEWNVTAVRADRVWSRLGVTGEGIVIGGSDSGVDLTHPALADGYRGGDYSWHDPWHGTAFPSDQAGHGTHTMGSAVGRGGIGVAPGAAWTACRNLDRNLGNPALYLDCLQFMLAPFPVGGDPWRDGSPQHAPHVLTNSWGCPPIEGCDVAALGSATAALAAAGIFVVAAAGNSGPFCGSIDHPIALYPDVFTVGAVDADLAPALFSSRGPAPAGVTKPDLVAPGVGVVSALPGGGYARLSGTSMATPQVAGVVALMWSANPGLIGDVATTTELLRSTTQPARVDAPECGGPAAVVGAGLVDAEAAVEAARRQ